MQLIDKRRDAELMDLEEIAIISHARYGMSDRDVPWLQFSLSFLGGGTQLGFSQPEANAIIIDANVGDVKDLNGKACVILKEDGLVRYRRMFK